MFVNDNNNNKDEDEEELEYRDGYGYGYGYDNLINREFYCDLKLVPFVRQLFEIIEMETGFPPDASQKVECLLKKHPNIAGIYSNLHGGYALHWACQKQAPLEVIVALTNVFPNALYECKNSREFTMILMFTKCVHCIMHYVRRHLLMLFFFSCITVARITG